MFDRYDDFEISEIWFENKPMRMENDHFSEKNRHARAREYEAVRYNSKEAFGQPIDSCIWSLMALAVGLIVMLFFINL